MEIALFLQSQMNQREQVIFVPTSKIVKINAVPRTPVSEIKYKNHEQREWKNKNKNEKNNNNNNNNSFKPQQQTQNQQQQRPKHVLIQKRKVEEKAVDGSCEICLKAGKEKAAFTHSTTQHDSSYVNKKWGEKKQKVESKTKNQ